MENVIGVAARDEWMTTPAGAGATMSTAELAAAAYPSREAEALDAVVAAEQHERSVRALDALDACDDGDLPFGEMI